MDRLDFYYTHELLSEMEAGPDLESIENDLKNGLALLTKKFGLN